MTIGIRCRLLAGPEISPDLSNHRLGKCLSSLFIQQYTSSISQTSFLSFCKKNTWQKICTYVHCAYLGYLLYNISVISAVRRNLQKSSLLIGASSSFTCRGVNQTLHYDIPNLSATIYVDINTEISFRLLSFGLLELFCIMNISFSTAEVFFSGD